MGATTFFKQFHNITNKTMKPEFHEDFSSDKLDPLAKPMQEDFNWNELYERLGEPTDEPEIGNRHAEVVRALIDWLVGFDFRRPNAVAHAGLRLFALTWVTDPARFDGISGSELAETLGVARKADFWELTGEVSKKFGIVNRCQAHAWNRGMTLPPRRRCKKAAQKPSDAPATNANGSGKAVPETGSNFLNNS